MLNTGHMYIGDSVYTLHELKTENFYRFDILKYGAEFHMDVDDIPFSCYRVKRLRCWGDVSLYQILRYEINVSVKCALLSRG